MAEKYPSRSLPDQTTGDRNESIGDQCGPVVDQSESTGDQPGQIAGDADLDPVQMLMTDRVSALQYAQTTGATTVNFIETQYNASGGQTIQNISYPGQTEPSTSDMAKETAATLNLHECQEELRAYYLKETGKVNLLPWIPEESKTMESIFVELEVVRKEKEESKASQKIKSNDDLVTLKTNQGQRVNRVLVTGDAGSGKSTTACNLAYKWAKNDPQSPLSKFSLVFLIRIKDIDDSNSSLVDLIFEHILTEDSSVSKEGLIIYIKENANDILFVIDGMDEDSSGALTNKSSEITKLLRNTKLPKSCVILTSRPRSITDLGMDVRHYTQVKLVGFSVKNIRIYIVKFFRDDKEKVDLLFRKLEAEPHVLALASIPVLLLMICLLLQDRRTTPKTKTQLYQKTIGYLWRRNQARMGGHSSLGEDLDNEKFEKNLKDLLNKLGEVALNNIHLGCEKYIFTVTEFGRGVCDLGCEVGILKREQSRIGLEKKTSVAFLHATFQEFCAAFHLAYLLETKQKQLGDFDGKLFSETEDAFIYQRYVLEFCCGILPEVTSTFLQIQTKRVKRTVSIAPDETRKPFDFHVSTNLQHIFEGQLSYKQCSNLIPLLSGCSCRIDLTDDLIPSILYILELYKSSTTQTGFLSTIESLEVKTGCTPWLPNLLKHTNNLNFYVVYIGISEIVGDLDNMYKALSELPHLKELALINVGIHGCDATNLLIFLSKKRVKLTRFELGGFQFDEKVMVRYLASTRTSILRLALSGTIDTQGQYAINNVIKQLPRLELRHLNHLVLWKFQIHSAVKNLRPIIAQLEALALNSCSLHEKHLKELFSFPSRAQQLKSLDLSVNMFSVTIVKVLVECLKKIPFLEKLLLEDTGLNDESACIIARFVRGRKGSSINALCLDDNPGIGHVGKVALKGLPLKRYVSSGLYDGEYENIPENTMTPTAASQCPVGMIINSEGNNEYKTKRKQTI